MTAKPLTILLAAPRGFCAGVDRAIQIVERALEKYGAPVYVRHEIVHNRYVVDDLKVKGAVFVESLDEVPDDGQPVIFSAHGVPKSVPEEAQRRTMFYIDATCPLVSKVHREAERHHASGRTVILIGHAGHPEVIGTMGQLPPGAVVLLETVTDVETLPFSESEKLAYCTQTTLSVEDTGHIVAALRARFPDIAGPHREDICYATTNRQAAVRAIASRCDALIVVGAPNSSNSRRLADVAGVAGCPRAFLVQRATDIDWTALSDIAVLGLSAGASAPEILVDEVIEAARARFDVQVEEVAVTHENVEFKLPRLLTGNNDMKCSGKDFLNQSCKAITLIGMSGVGKSHTACRLADWGWYNYSCDWLIGTRYLKEAVCAEGAMAPEDIGALSEFVGRIGDTARGGLGLAEFERRQRLYGEAECAALRDLAEGLTVAREKGQSFVNDSTGSLCEIEDESLLERVGARTLIVYLKVRTEDHPKILDRAIQYPKPLYFPPAFFKEALSAYQKEFDASCIEEIAPDSFLRWVFPRLFSARLPKYQRIADRWGVTIPAERLVEAQTESEILNLIAEALDERAR